MVARGVHHLAQCITCHAWNADMSMAAVCPNNNEVHIYKVSPSPDTAWERVYILEKHDQLVSGIDWAPKSNKIVTCSHDRNSYVWSLEGDEWQATLVILRLNRAATSVQWGPQENKFAVGSGAKTLCVCYYEEDNNWWVSKLLRKKHHSTVTSVSWHPNNVLLATTSTDRKCRIFSAFIKGVDARKDATTSFGDVKFGDELIQLDLACGWAFGAQWSPSGNSLAYVGTAGKLHILIMLHHGYKEHTMFQSKFVKWNVNLASPVADVKRVLFVLGVGEGHDSSIHFIMDVGPTPRARSLSLRHLPLRDVLFLSETRLVAGGFDCNPMLFVSEKTGDWEFISFLDEVKLPEEPKSDTLFAAAKGKFKWLGSDSSEENAPLTIHQSCITFCSMLRPLVPLSEKNPEKAIALFSTSGLDGRIVIWDLNNVGDGLARLRL